MINKRDEMFSGGLRKTELTYVSYRKRIALLPLKTDGETSGAAKFYTQMVPTMLEGS